MMARLVLWLCGLEDLFRVCIPNWVDDYRYYCRGGYKHDRYLATWLAYLEEYERESVL